MSYLTKEIAEDLAAKAFKEMQQFNLASKVEQQAVLYTWRFEEQFALAYVLLQVATPPGSFMLLKPFNTLTDTN